MIRFLWAALQSTHAPQIGEHFDIFGKMRIVMLDQLIEQQIIAPVISTASDTDGLSGVEG